MTRAEWNDIQAVLAQAIEMAPEERSAYLRTHCLDEAMLQQVQSFLGNYEELGNFLDPAAGPDPLQPGKMVGPYRLARELDYRR